MGSPKSGLGDVFTHFDNVCRQLTRQVESSSETETELREQISALRSDAQKAEQNIQELRKQMRKETDVMSRRKLSTTQKGPFDVDFPHSACSAMEVDLGQRESVGHSPKALRVKSLKGNLVTGHVAFNVLDRAPSCPSLPAV